MTVLEASAGTGKTYTIAALVARYVADGVPASGILAVTFTRMATSELRERVRERLVAVTNHLGALRRDGTPPPLDDPVATVIAQGTDDQVATRHHRLADALATFDEATITTTHGFCQLVLASMGVAGDAATGERLLEDVSELLDEVVDDLYLRRSLGWGEVAFSRDDAFTVACAAVVNPDTPLEPADDDDSARGRRRRFADLARREVARRFRDTSRITYDEVLIRLRDVLVDPARGTEACKRLAGRHQVVLVDEFQDTDPVQWQVFQRAFGGGTRLVLIGDPKQAIYAFRGADVHTYLEASASAHRRYTLADNWRSDQDLLDAFDALLTPLQFGHRGIPYRRVRAIPAHHRPGVVNAPSPAALRVRVLYGADHGDLDSNQFGFQKTAAVGRVAADLAADVVGLLDSRARLVTWDGDGSAHEGDRVAPGDVAVLVRINRHIGDVQRALRAAGVPAVAGAGGSVLGTTAAADWLQLLEALEQPASRSHAVAFALGPFTGMRAVDVAEDDHARMELVHTRLRRWGEILRRHGVATLFRVACEEGGVAPRLLTAPDGERQLTDLAHVAQLLGAEAAASQSGLPSLRAWLARRIHEDNDAEDADERTRRLDSDAQAVQILTVHRAKGLEFPFVYLPYLWDGWSRDRKGQPVVFHDQTDHDRRKLDVAGAGAAYDAHVKANKEEELGEQLRHLYVALTRARHQVTLWWARAMDCKKSPLGRLLFDRDGEGRVGPGVKDEPTDEDVERRLQQLLAAAPGRIAVDRVAVPTDAPWARPLGPAPDSLALAVCDRVFDMAWRRTSYSAITAAAHDSTIGSEPERRGTIDEPSTPSIDGDHRPGPAAAARAELLAPCLLADMPGGADVGTLVHRVLERADFAAEDLPAEIADAIAVEQARHGADLGPPELAVAGIVAALRTPLGALAGDVRLADLARHDRLDELAFEYPIAGGDTPSGVVSLAEIAAMFARHAGPGTPVAGYAERLADPALGRAVRGYMAGSLDVVFRRRTDAGPVFYVVDYKSNRLTPAGSPLVVGDYTPDRLAAEMQRLHYNLQAAIYTVALHRYLRWRLAGYQPELHVGGTLYLFLRGMVGPGTPLVDGQPCGVFAWRPPAALVTDLSDLFDRPTSGVAS